MIDKRRSWRSRRVRHAGAATTLLAVVATLAGSIGASGASASPSPDSNTPATTSAPAATTAPSFSGGLDHIKAQAARWIADRITALTNETAVVKAKSDLGTDSASLVAEMQADITGLEVLGATIAGDTTLEKARADSELIFTEFRVYLLMLPVADFVIHVDGVTNVDLPDIAKAVTWLESQENLSNQGVLGPLVANMQSQAQIATGATSGLSAQLLGYTPAEWDANHGLLSAAEANIVIAARAVSTAAKDAQEAHRYLRHHTSSTTTTSSGRLAAIQARAAKLIAARVASLEAGINKVQGDSFLGTDGAALVTEVQADIVGLNTLGTKIAADVTVSEAETDAALIFEFRVYSLVLPAVRAVTYVDWADSVKLPATGKEVTRIQGQENSRTQPFLAPIVANMQLEVQTATLATNGLSAELLSYTAAEWDANRNLLSGAEANIYVTQKAISVAGNDFARAERYIRNPHRHHRR